MTLIKNIPLVALAALLSLAMGCEEEKKSKSKDKADEEIDVSKVDIDIDGDDYGVYTFSELKLPYETTEACVEHAATTREDTSTMAACLCDGCLDLMQECDVLPGCVEIRACVQKSKCNDEFSCYLLPGAPCTEVIDRWGNASLAVTISIGLMDCTTENKCK